jgi:hypothetical protein
MLSVSSFDSTISSSGSYESEIWEGLFSEGSVWERLFSEGSVRTSFLSGGVRGRNTSWGGDLFLHLTPRRVSCLDRLRCCHGHDRFCQGVCVPPFTWAQSDTQVYVLYRQNSVTLSALKSSSNGSLVWKVRLFDTKSSGVVKKHKH